MIMSKRKNSIRRPLTLFVIAAIAAIVTWTVGATLSASQKNTREELQRELAALPSFDRNKELLQLTATFKIDPAMLRKTYPGKAELETRIESQLKIEVEKNFSAEKLQELLDKIDQENNAGKVVEIKYYNESGMVETVKGEYEAGDSNTVIVKGKSIRRKNLLPESRQALKLSMKKVDPAKVEKEFMDNRDIFSRKVHGEIRTKVFTEAGYICTSKQEWMTPRDFIDRELEIKAQQATKARQDAIAALQRKYKAWGLFTFNFKPSHP